MSLTNNCLICGTKLDFGEDTLLIKSRQEICFRFNTLVSRFLNLTSVKCSSTLNINCNNFNGESVCCFSCLSVVESFCETYTNWECLQLELFHTLGAISRRVTSFSNSFQNDFRTKVERKRQQHYPHVPMKRLSVKELQILKNEFSGFTPIKSEPTENIEVGDEDLSDFPDFSDQVDESVVTAVESNTDVNFVEAAEGKLNLKQDLDTINATGDFYKGAIKKFDIQPEPESSKKSKRSSVSYKSRPRVNECFICDKTFLSGRDLFRHIRCHTHEKPHHCRECQREFKAHYLLTRHRKYHHIKSGSKPVSECNFCGQFFQDIRTHVTRVHGPKTFICNFCGRGFSYEGDFKRHQTSHTGERNFSCELCNRKFKYPGDLSLHKQRQCSGKFQCDICNKLVVDIRSHRLYMHSSVRKLVCENCGKGFVSQSQLKKHLHSQHSDQMAPQQFGVETPGKNVQCNV